MMLKTGWLICFFLSWGTTVQAQRFTIELNSGKRYSTREFAVAEDLFRRIPRIVFDNNRFSLEEVKSVTDSSGNQVYRPVKFRRRMELFRVLEEGNIHLYDHHFPLRSEQRNLRRSAIVGRLFIQDTVVGRVRLLKRKNFDEIFSMEFRSGYPDYASIKRRYLRLAPYTHLSMFMIPCFIVATGFQSLAVLIPYTAATIFVTGSATIKRQQKLSDLREMIRVYNQRVQ